MALSNYLTVLINGCEPNLKTSHASKFEFNYKKCKLRACAVIVSSVTVSLIINSSCSVLDLIFRNNFFIFNFSKMCSDESCRGELLPTSPKGLVLVAQTDFCVYR